MIVFDDKIRISLNNYGGVIMYFNGYHLWNTLGGQWAVGLEDKRENLKEDGALKTFGSVIGAFTYMEEQMGRKLEGVEQK